MTGKKISFAATAVALALLLGCAQTRNATRESIIAFDEKAEMVPWGELGVESKASIVVIFNDSEQGKLHQIKICLCDDSLLCSLIGWEETDLHPSDPGFERLVNDLWNKHYPLSPYFFKEEVFYPEPVGKHKIEAIYYPREK